MVDAGVDPKVVQEILRHSIVELTLGRYSHVYRGRTSEAVAKLPDFSKASDSQAQMKTVLIISPWTAFRARPSARTNCAEITRKTRTQPEK
jgi:hypothetical protein